MRILIVEDEIRIANDLSKALEAAGYTIETAADGETAWFMGDTEDYDAIILDLGLPKLDGLTVLKRWRAADNNTPILVLSARGTWTERVDGIDAGADDYLPKPFEMEELLARLRAIVRRSTGNPSPFIEIGEVRLDERQMRVSVRGVPINLTPLEYRFVSYLMHHKERIVSQTELSEHVYAQDQEHESNAMEALVSRIRRKLGVDLIETRRGFGYCIKAQDVSGIGA
ncbi:response regulator transcription factor [Microvirga sp. W0021]|uniref:Response regulator transcription factor n=1 Tax=Hohaiivirga grylli TaxID=3133970 RepID=A0ABV0BFW9_9HYPH